MKLTSQTTKLILSWIIELSKYLALKFSILIIFFSFFNFSWSWFVPTSIEYIFLAFFFKRTSVNPPVDEPISRQILFSISILKWSIALSNLNAPLDTHGGCSCLIFIFEFSLKLLPLSVSYTHLTLPTIYSV